MKLAVITCYKHLGYVRGETLWQAASQIPDIETIAVKNRRPGLLRYPEVLGKLIWVRLRHRPDAYLLTFRGYEILGAVGLLTWPKPLIYDEFINPFEWLQEPRPEKWVRFVPRSVLRRYYNSLLKRCRYVLTDTDAHINLSRRLSGDKTTAYQAIPVGADEQIFRPASKHSKRSSRFRVFYYGNMLPLHGIRYVLEAAVELRGAPIEFVIAGGGEKTRAAVESAQAAGANISYKPWIPYRELPAAISEADLCLGGPFGDTVQAQHVVTGKTYQFLASQKPALIGRTKAAGLFKDRQNCLMVPLGDSEALAAAIGWASQHRGELAAIGKNGRQLYLDEFSILTISRKLSLILDGL